MVPSVITQAGHTMAPWDHQAHGQPLLGTLLTLVAFLSCKWPIGTKSFLLCLVTVTLSLPSTSAHPHTQPHIHTYTHIHPPHTEHTRCNHIVTHHTQTIHSKQTTHTHTHTVYIQTTHMKPQTHAPHTSDYMHTDTYIIYYTDRTYTIARYTAYYIPPQLPRGTWGRKVEGSLPAPLPLPLVLPPPSLPPHLCSPPPSSFNVSRQLTFILICLGRWTLVAHMGSRIGFSSWKLSGER